MIKLIGSVIQSILWIFHYNLIPFISDKIYCNEWQKNSSFLEDDSTNLINENESNDVETQTKQPSFPDPLHHLALKDFLNLDHHEHKTIGKFSNLAGPSCGD